MKYPMDVVAFMQMSKSLQDMNCRLFLILKPLELVQEHFEL